MLRAVRRSAELDWSALAANRGYADQAHLVHEFRELAGITLESVNDVFNRLRAGKVNGRVVLGIGEQAFERKGKELMTVA